jgi:hypothetical protein
VVGRSGQAQLEPLRLNHKSGPISLRNLTEQPYFQAWPNSHLAMLCHQQEARPGAARRTIKEAAHTGLLQPCCSMRWHNIYHNYSINIANYPLSGHAHR